jgi:hypothetical protein
MSCFDGTVSPPPGPGDATDSSPRPGLTTRPHHEDFVAVGEVGWSSPCSAPVEGPPGRAAAHA